MTAVEQAAIYRGPRSDLWETPSWLWKQLDEQYAFSCDLAANASNTKRPTYFSEDRSFLACDGFLGVAWLNPPFSLAAPFFCKLEALSKRGTRTVAIYKSGNMETMAWRYIFGAASWIVQPDKRINYARDGVEMKGVQFASALIGFNVPEPHIATRAGWVTLRVQR